MTAHVVTRVPLPLVPRGRVLRSADTHSIYAYPRPEFRRLERAGALHRLADGLYAVVPDDRVGYYWIGCPTSKPSPWAWPAQADIRTAPRSWESAPLGSTAPFPERSMSPQSP